MKDKKVIVSFSGGKDSTCMLLMMLEKGMRVDYILFCDTGMEFPEMYDHIKKVDEYINKHYGKNITYLQPLKPFEYYLLEEKEIQKMNNVKNQIVPHIFDRVHNAYYGYGTIIGLVTPEGVIHEDFDALVLFDERNTDLHCAYYYEYWNLTTGFNKCEPYFPTSDVVRANRCFWVRVYDASTTDVVLYEDEVRLVPFGTLEYRQHPIRVKLKCANSPEMHSASIVAIDRDEDYSLIAFDKEVNEEFLRSHDGKGLTTYYDNILKTFWPAKDVYYWTNINNLSFDEELLGTVSPFDMNDKEDADEEKKDVEEGEDTVASPFYYKIARVEPNELMTDLMSFEQHEGFLWGNIIKYAYRYGNKGEKAETVKKIRKYCDMLLEILEPKSELED